MRFMYKDSKHTKLGASVMFMNLATMHPALTRQMGDDI